MPGLTELQARTLLVERGALPRAQSSRSYASIVRANLLTPFNAILAVAGGMTLAFGEWQDALFLGVLVANTGIGATEEIRAKRALDRLSLLVAPVATVVRDGQARAVPVEEVVVGDLVELAPGDQLAADGVVERESSFLVDESILTGESAAVTRHQGETVRSGSFAVEGSATYTVTAVGAESYAARISGEARSFRHPRSPLERSLNRLLLVLVAVMVPLATVLCYALWHRHTHLHTAVPTAVAAVVTLVPEGLVLLASLTYAVASVRMARRGALAQQLNAIESLASVDVVCIDKTGTLTEASLHVAGLVGPVDFAADLARYAASASSSNETLRAIAAAYPGEAEPLDEEVGFSSRRRFGGQRRAGQGWVLGAPEHFALGEFTDAAHEASLGGRRVLALGRSDELEAERPAADGLVLLAEELRPDAAETVDWFHRQGVELKVISGDRPETVAAIARDAGILGPFYPETELPEDDAELRRVVGSYSVFGRVSPDGKRRIVQALTAEGRYVAMVGDGVNDVPALKAARLAIAQGAGTQMARSVSDIVLVSGNFGAVPAMVEEGRKILRNVQRVAKLFVTKSAFAVFVILSIGLTPTAYPLLPRQLTLAATVTIGVPGFFLALAPSSGRYSATSFLRDLARFALPAGAAAGLGVVSSYLFTLNVLEARLIVARTVAVTVLVLVGLFLILALEASGKVRGAAISTLCAAMFAGYLAVLLIPPMRAFFELAPPSLSSVLPAIGGAALAILGLIAVDDRFVPGRADAGATG
ncbi:MAG: HAD-IC family P-type ATPase [Actinomycetes bacterium]